MNPINWRKGALAAAVLLALASAADGASFREEPGDRRPYTSRRSDAEVLRVRRIMLPLLRVADRRIDVDDIRIKIVDEREVNAASAGNGRYYITTGLLRRASDDQLRGVLAHEIAHEDLGHPAKAQLVGAGLSLGVALLDQLIPGSSSYTPLAGSLISSGYTRPLELEADRHAVELLRRSGYSKRTMIDTLDWLMRSNGDSGGSILSTHPATSERIRALHALR